MEGQNGQQGGWINPDGSFGDIDTAPDNVREIVSKKGYKSVADLADAYSSAEKKFGVSPDRLVTWPKDENDSEGWNQIYNRLRPETPDKYSIKFKAPDGIEISDDLVSKFKQYAHEKGMSDKMFNDVVQFQLDASVEMQKIMAQQAKEAEEQSAKELALSRDKAFGELKKNHNIKTDAEMAELISKAKKVAEDTGIFNVLETKKLSDDPEIISALIGLSQRVSDSAIPNKTVSGEPNIDQKLKELTSNPAFTDALHPDHQKVMAEFRGLHGIK